MLKFNDGMTFDTSGPIRAERRKDGWYVLGDGMLCAVDCMADALKLVFELKEKRGLNNPHDAPTSR
ncbi:MAG: hypothetical protein CME70_18870 [Halobacteriovorax sp.]|nr:hypothetical protein [Halobacteriovorax sp.]